MTKQDYIFIGIVTSVVLGAIGFVVWIYRKSVYTVKEGELQNEDPVGIMQTWDTKSDEVISRLHPKVRKKFSDFVNDLFGQGITYRLYSGFRSFDEQAELYGKGRTVQDLISNGVDPKWSKPAEKKVTNAKPGTSYHNYGLAGDGVEIKNGQALWTNPNQQKIVDTAKKYGLYWGGNFVSFKDTPHFEDQTFGTVNQLLAIYNNNQKDSQGYLLV